MVKIGLLSDTHNYLDAQINDYFSDRDEIWHAGDFGSIDIARSLETIGPVTGVYGNIDGKDIRDEFPLDQRLVKEGAVVWMRHIGGVAGSYCIPIREQVEWKALVLLRRES